MNIQCISAVGVNNRMELSDSEDRFLPLVSADIASPNVIPGEKAFYVSYGSTAALAMGAAYMTMRQNGDLPYAVQVTLKVKSAGAEDLTVRDAKELKKTNTLCLFKMRKPLADLMIACWHTWLETKVGKRVVRKADREEVSTLNRITELVSMYPIFLDYLVQQPQFKHIKHFMFKTWIADNRIVTVLALYNPDIPKYGISCDRLPSHIHPVMPGDMPNANENVA